jgi:4'-phosphopantetheinyl transferase
VWRADLAAVADEVCGLLCGEERARAERMLNERARQLWMRSRGLLRALLGGYLQQDPRTLRLATGAHGKPALLESWPAATATADLAAPSAAPLSFNLSHSGHLALYAFTTAGPIGVDVEVARRPIDAVGIARRAFGAAEAERLAGLEPKAREQEFLRAWVRREAELKCMGTGIGGAEAPAGGRAAWIAELEMGPRAAAAVAAGGRPRELRCWNWPPVHEQRGAASEADAG